MSGPFKLPGGYELASPVYIIEPSKTGVIQKPCTVRIQHYVKLLKEADIKNIVFFSSDSKPQSDVGFVFKEIEGPKQIFKPGSQFGELELNHFCCLTTGKRLSGK